MGFFEVVNVLSCSPFMFENTEHKQLDRRIRHSHLASTLFHSLVHVVTSAKNPVPDNSPQSIRELRNGHVANIQELYYTRLVKKMAWYKILIQVLIV